MKKYTYSLILAAAASGLALGAETAYTTPVGYETTTLNPSSFNLISVRLQSPTSVAGNFETIAGTTLTDTGASFGTVLTAGGTYVLEISSSIPALNGVIQEVTSWSGDSITTAQDLAALGLTSSDTYKLRKAPTIEQVFGTTTSVLSKGATAAAGASDIVWIPIAPGSYTRYYIRSTDSTVRNAQTNAAAPNVPIVYVDGIFVEKKATGSASLVVSGEVKTKATTSVASLGFNLLGTIYPAGATLQNLGLEDDISKGATAAAAASDIVWVPSGPNTYTRYYLRSTDSTWRNAQTNAAAPADVALPTAIFIERKTASSINLDLTPPASYNSL
jgi:hypothetical protein